jgi:hypothetical protein
MRWSAVEAHRHRMTTILASLPADRPRVSRVTLAPRAARPRRASGRGLALLALGAACAVGAALAVAPLTPPGGGSADELGRRPITSAEVLAAMNARPERATEAAAAASPAPPAAPVRTVTRVARPERP